MCHQQHIGPLSVTVVKYLRWINWQGRLLVPRVSVSGGFAFVAIPHIMAGHVAEEAAHLREAKKQREKQEGAGGSISASRSHPSMPKFLPCGQHPSSPSSVSGWKPSLQHMGLDSNCRIAKSLQECAYSNMHWDGTFILFLQLHSTWG